MDYSTAVQPLSRSPTKCHTKINPIVCDTQVRSMKATLRFGGTGGGHETKNYIKRTDTHERATRTKKKDWGGRARQQTQGHRGTYRACGYGTNGNCTQLLPAAPGFDEVSTTQQHKSKTKKTPPPPHLSVPLGDGTWSTLSSLSRGNTNRILDLLCTHPRRTHLETPGQISSQTLAPSVVTVVTFTIYFCGARTGTFSKVRSCHPSSPRPGNSQYNPQNDHHSRLSIPNIFPARHPILKTKSWRYVLAPAFCPTPPGPTAHNRGIQHTTSQNPPKRRFFSSPPPTFLCCSKESSPAKHRWPRPNPPLAPRRRSTSPRLCSNLASPERPGFRVHQEQRPEAGVRPPAAAGSLPLVYP